MSNLDRDVEQRLHGNDVRYTTGRRAVVHALADAEGPRSASELHEIVGSVVPLSSLYRTLAVLEDADVIAPHFGARGLTRYELAEWITGHHHHFVCLECGAVDDIDVPRGVEERVNAVVSEIAERASFAPTSHVLEIEGRCRRCR
jgi:Fur family transcriptional regulator, ferric uptake regulator